MRIDVTIRKSDFNPDKINKTFKKFLFNELGLGYLKCVN